MFTLPEKYLGTNFIHIWVKTNEKSAIRTTVSRYGYGPTYVVHSVKFTSDGKNSWAKSKRKSNVPMPTLKDAIEVAEKMMPKGSVQLK